VLGAFFLSAFAISGLSTIATSASTASTTSSNQTMPTIDFSVGTQTTKTVQHEIDDFNANYSASYGFKVKLDEQAFSTTNQHDTYLADFQAQSTSIDVVSMDVIWPAEFANSGYILPLDDVFNKTYQADFLQAPIEAGTVNGHIYGVPWFHDSAMLYYRTDILTAANNAGVINDPNGAAPTTWAQLKDWSSAIMNDTSFTTANNLTAGFVWQGASYEGLMCDFMEYIGGTGTYSFLNDGQTQAIFNTSAGISAALTYMRSLITSGASPSAVLTYMEESSRAVWNAGNAVFMRNWPYAYSGSLNSAALNGSLVSGANHNVQQFDVTTMPAENSSVTNPRTSCLGGWQVGVSAFSKYPDQAKKFVMWITNAKEQTDHFLKEGETPTLTALYNSAAIKNSP
jgi:multiple sugar transport system substrate-binding protein